MKIEAAKPPSHYCHYSNPSCQGSLMRQTPNWPQGPLASGEERWISNVGWECPPPVEGPAAVPDGLDFGDAYQDRMWEWDRPKMEAACKHLSRGFDSTGEELIAFAKAYFDVDVVAVRTVYYFNQATGHPCPRIDYLYKPEGGE